MNCLLAINRLNCIRLSLSLHALWKFLIWKVSPNKVKALSMWSWWLSYIEIPEETDHLESICFQETSQQVVPQLCHLYPFLFETAIWVDLDFCRETMTSPLSLSPTTFARILVPFVLATLLLSLSYGSSWYSSWFSSWRFSCGLITDGLFFLIEIAEIC